MPFKQYIRKDDDKGEYWEGQTFEEHLALCDAQLTAGTLLELLPRESVILEAGCGLGRWVVYLRQRGYRIVGLDMSHGNLSRCRAHGNRSPVVAGDILHMPFRDSTFSAILSFGVVEHLEDEIASAFKEMERLLSPAGVLFLAVPCVNMLRRFFIHPYILARNLVRKLRGILLVFAEYRYSRTEVERLMAQNGFKPILTVPDDLRLPFAMGLCTDLSGRVSVPGRKFQLNTGGLILERFLRFLSPWVSCGGVFCVARRRNPTTAAHE